jgi:hypothetical protein
MEFHLRQAKRFESDPRRHALHSETAERFRETLDILKTPSVGVESPALRSTPKLNLEWSELQDLPPELMAELSISDSDKLDFSIASLIEDVGGVATLDRVLVSIFKLTGEILKRATLNARLWRMVQKEMIFSVPGKKGVYSSRQLTEEEAKLRSLAKGCPIAYMSVVTRSSGFKT